MRDGWDCRVRDEVAIDLSVRSGPGPLLDGAEHYQKGWPGHSRKEDLQMAPAISSAVRDSLGSGTQHFCNHRTSNPPPPDTRLSGTIARNLLYTLPFAWIPPPGSCRWLGTCDNCATSIRCTLGAGRALSVLASGWETTVYEFHAGGVVTKVRVNTVGVAAGLRFYQGSAADAKAASRTQQRSIACSRRLSVPTPTSSPMTMMRSVRRSSSLQRWAGGQLFATPQFSNAFKTFPMAFF